MLTITVDFFSFLSFFSFSGRESRRGGVEQDSGERRDTLCEQERLFAR